VFVAASLVAVFAANHDVWRTHTVDVLSWIIPFQSPAPLPWEEGWLSTPLWFLRALLLVLLFAPIGIRIGRKLSAPVWVAIWAAALVTLDAIIARQTSVRITAVMRGVGDLVCFGGFFALGVVGHHLRREFARLYHRGRVLILLLAVTAAVTWIAPPAGMIVNNSNLTMALVGLCWLSVVILFEDQFRLIGEIPGVHRVLGWVASNSMTVYLWHTAVLCVAFAIAGPPSSTEDVALLALVFVPLLTFTVITMRPFEHRWSPDRGAHPLRHVKLAVLAVVACVMVAQPTLFPQVTDAVGPPAPSARPAVGAGAAKASTARGGGGITGWMVGNNVESAAVVVVTADGRQSLTYADGQSPDPTADHDGQQPIDGSEQFEAMSVTKTMVAVTALQLVDEGLVTLDGPLPSIPGVPVGLTSSLSLRRLLAHATGLVDYRTVDGFDPTEPVEPLQAILDSYAVSDTGDQSVSYSSTNYFVVGLLIEHLTGETLAAQLQTRIFEPLGLRHTELVNNTRSGFVGFASGGLVSTLDDLATWYDALFRKKAVLSPAMLDEMVWGGREFSSGGGLGAWRHCPCGPPTDANPSPWLYIFHDGGDVRVMYYPADDVVMVARFSEPLYLTPPLAGDIDGFVLQVLGDVTGKPGTP
jgi:CubicO group peptidase (beta-lactamase class C family)